MTDTATTEAFKPAKGMYVKFIGYESDTPDPLLQPGDIVYVQTYDATTGMTVTKIGSEVGENLFDEEVTAATDEEIAAAQASAAQASAPAEETAKGKGKAKGKATGDSAVVTSGRRASSEDEEEEMSFEIVNDLEAVRKILEAQDAHTAARSLVNRSEELAFTLGGVLAHIYKEGLHKQAGYHGKRAFPDYCTNELGGLGYRKARYLINIYVKVTSLGIPEDRLAGIGWSKVKDLIGLETKEQFEAGLEFARTNPKSAIADYVREQYENAEDNTNTGVRVKRTRMTFAFTSEAADTVKAALKSAETVAGSTDPSDCLEHIIGEWRSSQEGIEVPLDEAIALLEARYDVRLQVVNQTAEEASATVAN